MGKTRLKPTKDKHDRDGKVISVREEILYKKDLPRRKVIRPVPKKILPFTAIPREGGRVITYLAKSQVDFFSLEIQKVVPNQEWMDEMENLVDEKRRFELYWRKKQLALMKRAKWLLLTREGKRIKGILDEKLSRKKRESSIVGED